jgi:hypothetical protein
MPVTIFSSSASISTFKVFFVIDVKIEIEKEEGEVDDKEEEEEEEEETIHVDLKQEVGI